MTISIQPITSAPTTPNSDSPGRFVDAEDLICPGCGEQVRCAPPEISHGLDPEPEAEFSHLDRSELCRTRTGQVADPIEASR